VYTQYPKAFWEDETKKLASGIDGHRCLARILDGKGGRDEAADKVQTINDFIINIRAH
jgi:hypothetical protein